MEREFSLEPKYASFFRNVSFLLTFHPEFLGCSAKWKPKQCKREPEISVVSEFSKNRITSGGVPHFPGGFFRNALFLLTFHPKFPVSVLNGICPQSPVLWTVFTSHCRNPPTSMSACHLTRVTGSFILFWWVQAICQSLTSPMISNLVPRLFQAWERGFWVCFLRRFYCKDFPIQKCILVDYPKASKMEWHYMF